MTETGKVSPRNFIQKNQRIYRGNSLSWSKKWAILEKTEKLPKNEKDIALRYRQDYLERKVGGKKK